MSLSTRASVRCCLSVDKNSNEELRVRRRREQNRQAAQRSRDRQRNLTDHYLKVRHTHRVTQNQNRKVSAYTDDFTTVPLVRFRTTAENRQYAAKIVEELY